MVRGNFWPLTILGLALFTTFACSRPPSGSGNPGASGAVVLHGGGATFPAPLYAKWIEEYRQVNPAVEIRYASAGSGLGTDWFLAGELPQQAVRQAGVNEPAPSPVGDNQSGSSVPRVPLHFGASDAGLTAEQRESVPGGAQVIPSTAGILVLAYNLPGVDSLKLSRAVYADIFLGKITRWNDPRIHELNPGIKFPRRDIAVVTRQDSSGTTFAFTRHLAAISDDWKKELGGEGRKMLDWPGETMRGNGNIRVAGMIQGIQYSIGYVEYGIARRSGLSMAALENQSGAFIEPSETSGRAALLAANDETLLPDPPGVDSYPIVTFTWLLAYNRYDDPAVARATKGFLSWCLSDGQQHNQDLGFLPLDETDRKRALSYVSAIAD